MYKLLKFTLSDSTLDNLFFLLFVDGSRAELENITNTIVTSSDDKDSVENKRILDDLHLHVKELEERRAKIQPIINLVDNMVRSHNFANKQPILLLVLELAHHNSVF